MENSVMDEYIKIELFYKRISNIYDKNYNKPANESFDYINDYLYTIDIEDLKTLCDYIQSEKESSSSTNDLFKNKSIYILIKMNIFERTNGLSKTRK